MRIPSALLTLLLAASLGACGGGGSGSSASTGTGSSGSVPAASSGTDSGNGGASASAATDSAGTPTGNAPATTSQADNSSGSAGNGTSNNTGNSGASSGTGSTSSGSTSSGNTSGGSTSSGNTAAVTWTVTDIGSVGNNYTSTAEAINNLGQIAGSAWLTNRDPQTDPSYPVFLYENGAITNLGIIGMPENPEVAAINDHGLMVGNHYNTFVAAYSEAAFRMQKDGTLSAMSSGDTNVVLRSATGVNNQGQIVGLYQRGGFRPDQIASAVFGAYLYDQEKMVDLKTLYGANTANAINNNGHIVGSNQSGHAYLLQNNVIADLGTLPGDAGSEAFAINDADQVVGSSVDGATHQSRAFLYANGKLTDLSTAGSLKDSIAFKINGKGQILIREQPGNNAYRYWLYDQGKLIDLSDLPAFASAGWTAIAIKSINDQGQIIGYGNLNGATRSFVLVAKNGS